MEGQLILGIDAGGGSTRAVLVRDGELISRHSRALANSPDPAGRRFFDEAADHSIALASALRPSVGDLPVVMVGRVFEIPVIAEPFTAATNAVKLLEAPEFGAVRLARGERSSRETALVT